MILIMVIAPHFHAKSEARCFLHEISLPGGLIHSPSKKRILIVDDDRDVCTEVSGVLAPYYDCEWITESTKALAFVEERRPHLILLDYQMPILKGTDICTQLKANRVLRDIPVVFISGVATVDEKIRAFECGANDFLLKPFHFRELLLRLQARLTPPSGRLPSKLTAENLQLDVLSRRAHVDGHEIFLTQRQFDILRVLVLHQNKIVTRQDCMVLVWGREDSKSRKLDSHISLLKAKLKNFKGNIAAIPGVGYSLRI